MDPVLDDIRDRTANKLREVNAKYSELHMAVGYLYRMPDVPVSPQIFYVQQELYELLDQLNALYQEEHDYRESRTGAS